MPWPAYSETFLYCTGANVTVTWTVPDNKRAVITSVLACSYSAGQGLNLKVHGRIALVFNFPAASTTQNLSLRLVAYERETIAGFTSSPDVHLHVSGYLLDDPTGSRPLPTDVERELVAEQRPTLRQGS